MTVGHSRLLLRIEEAADALAIGRSTLYELLRNGEIPVIHIGRSVRIAVADLEAYVEQRTEEPKQD